MSTAPVTLAAVTQTWIQKHERVVIMFLILSVAAFELNKYFDVAAAHADGKYAVVQQQADDAKTYAAQTAAQAAQIASASQAAIVALQKEKDALRASQVARNTVLVQNRAVVKTEPLDAVVSTWKEQIPSGSIVSGTNGVTVDGEAARDTVGKLIELPVVQQSLADEKQISANLMQQDSLGNQMIAADVKEISALNAQIVADAASCKAEVAAVKADARKGKAKWFKIGFVTGFISGLWAGHSAGL